MRLTTACLASCFPVQDGFIKLNKVFNMMLTEEQIEHLMRAIDVNGDGELSYNEFLNAFKIVDTGARK